MSEFYRDLLVLICIGLLGWGLIRVERIYQYPFFMGSVIASFVLPQAFALCQNPGGITEQALERVLLMSCLCAVACWLGYEGKVNRKWVSKLNIPIDERKLNLAAIVLMFQGLLFSFLISRTTIDRASNGNWTGPATIYLFLAQTINIAFSIFFLQVLKRPTLPNIVLTAVSGLPLLGELIGGRRQPTITFIIIVGLSFWLIKRIHPPRWSVVLALVLMFIIIPTLAELRGEFWTLLFNQSWNELQIAIQRALQGQSSGDILELRNAAVAMEASDTLNLFGYGSGWWDSIVFQYVPAQILGADFKDSLQIKLITPELLQKLYGYNYPTGTTLTGIGESFKEFGYFGALIFALLGYSFKHLWISATYESSMFSRFLYMGLVSPAMLAITHGVGWFLTGALFQIFFAGLVAYYSRARYSSSIVKS